MFTHSRPYNPNPLHPVQPQFSPNLFPPGAPAMIQPQPLPPGSDIAIQPQPLPPGGPTMIQPQPLPPGADAAIQPQPLPPGSSGTIQPQPLPPGISLQRAPVVPGVGPPLDGPFSSPMQAQPLFAIRETSLGAQAPA
ncbi:hypothetical protein ONZ45_g18027 [Pleurotus djamor]|nr:hypothetical protein ONZ45_g18027 [Pleurotus djamor]